jgi:hypothetical protein
MLKFTCLTTSIVVIALTASTSFASIGETLIVQPTDVIKIQTGEYATPFAPYVQQARRGGDDNSGSDRSGHSGGGRDSRDDSDDDDSNDNSDDNGSMDDSNDDDTNPSGRKKPRVPGGSGCDDAGDIAEHPECRA